MTESPEAAILDHEDEVHRLSLSLYARCSEIIDSEHWDDIQRRDQQSFERFQRVLIGDGEMPLLPMLRAYDKFMSRTVTPDTIRRSLGALFQKKEPGHPLDYLGTAHCSSLEQRHLDAYLEVFNAVTYTRIGMAQIAVQYPDKSRHIVELFNRGITTEQEMIEEIKSFELGSSSALIEGAL